MKRIIQKKLALLVIATFLFFLYLSVNFVFREFESWRVEKSFYLATQSQKENNSNTKLMYLEQASLLNPSKQNLLNAGICADELGYNSLARLYFSELKNAEGLYLLGNSYYKSGEYDKAKIQYSKAKALSDDKKIILALAKNLLKKGELDEANEQFDLIENIEEIDVEDRYLALLVKLSLYETSINITDLITDNEKKEILLRILNESEKNIDFLTLSEQFKSHGYPQAGFACLEVASQKGLLTRDGYLVLGSDYYSKKMYQESYYAFSKARGMDPYYPQTYQHLVEVAGLLGKNDEAEQFQNLYDSLSW